MKKRLSTIILILVFFVGLAVLLYPTISDWMNSQEQEQVINKYLQAVGQISEEDYKVIWADAEEYNKTLLEKTNRYHLEEAEYQLYLSLLNVSGNGVMGYLEIPKINLSIPIYHGTDESVLQVAVGHVAGSSLPVGGESTHCILSGHRGLPTAKLFTNLDKLQKGDTFMLKVLNETLTYEVDQILVTEPGDIKAMEIEEGKDYCTLMTCTPYGVNTHRLLIRGHRVDNERGLQ